MKQVVVNSVTYPSLAAAWRELGDWTVSFALARKRRSRGWTAKKAIVTPVIDPVDRRRSSNFAEVQLKKTGFEI